VRRLGRPLLRVGDHIVSSGARDDMEKRGLSLADIQEVPKESLILLSGPPGAGKSTFCHQMVLNNIAAERAVIFVTTEQSPSGVTGLLSEKGMGESTPGALSFVDAFTETVGLTCTPRSDTVCANCADLNSLSIAITKLRDRTGKGGVFLVFDSLTSPYLFSGMEVVKFMRLFLSKFASEGNSVLVLMDEGCGKEEDLGAMMSVADGIIRMEIKEKSRIINVVKHPKMAPTKIETPMTRGPAITLETLDPRVMRRIWEASFSARPGQAMRTEVGDFVNMFWRSLAFWSGMLWDAKRLPTIAYDFDKQIHTMASESMSMAPWHMRLLIKLFVPKSFSEVKDMKRLLSRFLFKNHVEMGLGTWEYVEKVSSKDEHYFRIYESVDCWGFDNVGARLGSLSVGGISAMLKVFEKEKRDWSVVETKCIGLGDHYCEFKMVPAETGELKDALESIDSSVVEKVHDRLMNQLTGFLVYGEPLPERPRLGSGIAFNRFMVATSGPALCSERYQMALRMGGARAGKKAGERLMESALSKDEAVKRVIDFMNYCKVGNVTLGETIKIRQNCEAFGLETGETSCFFTTGFLNGLFSAVKNKHVREVKCVAAGDPYCEWEII
jgi:predicted hydrocarbon binding protein/KaiC/GvpD/RAD55 family RecA-like ATPase